MKKTMILDDKRHVKRIVLECKPTEYMVIDRALSLLAVNLNIPLADRVIATRMLDTQMEKEVEDADKN